MHIPDLGGIGPLIGGVISGVATLVLFAVRKGVFDYFRPIAIICIERDEAVMRATENETRAEASDKLVALQKGTIEELEGRLGRVEKRLNHLVSYIRDTDIYIDYIESSLKGTRSEIASAGAAVERLEMKRPTLPMEAEL